MGSGDSRLSDIKTIWVTVAEARDGSTDTVRAAQRALLDRYGKAVRRYLMGALRDADAADDLFQSFALRLLHGDLRGADRSRGRFRDFIKGVLFHLVADHHNQKRRQPAALVEEPVSPEQEAAALAEADRAFLEDWRSDLLARAWTGLDALEQATGNPWYTVLRFRADHPELRSHEMAERLTTLLGKPISAVNVRQTLHRARDKFGDLLLYEVRQSLEDPTDERLEQELIDLGLFEYCRPSLDRQRGA
jgi:RNA polymerase sigma-70 factor (ECF subfamily)